MSTKLEAQSTEPIQAAVKAFVQGADAQNVDAIDAVLHEQYRVAWHDGQKADLILVDKSTYLSKIASKEWGGDKRKLKIEEVLVTGNANATVKATLIGEKADFRSYFSLVNNEGNWKIVQDLTTATFK